MLCLIPILSIAIDDQPPSYEEIMKEENRNKSYEYVRPPSEPHPHEQEVIVEVVEGNHPIEKQLFSGKLLSESVITKTLLNSQSDKNKPLQLQAKDLHGITLVELHTIMAFLSSAQNQKDKENVVIEYLKNLLNKGQTNIASKNKGLQYAQLNTAINLLQLANDLQIPAAENACIEILADYLLRNYTNGIPYEYGALDRNKFLDNLSSLPIQLQTKISKLFLIDAIHANHLLNLFNRFFSERSTKIISHVGEYGSNFYWSSDSRYLLCVPRSIPRGSNPYLYQWDSQTDVKAVINQTSESGANIDNKNENMTSAKSPNGKYVANLDKDNNIELLDAHTNQLIETLKSSNIPKGHKSQLSKLLWSPDSTKLAVGVAVDMSYNITVFLIDSLLKLKKELFSLNFDQIFFVIELVKPFSPSNYFFKTRSGDKIVLNDPKQKAQFESLPEELRKVFEYKIAQYNPKGNFYY